VWGVSLASFVLAAGTGTYFRFALIHRLPGVLEYIRHAHSHLMFFSWITPPLMLLIGAHLRRRGLRTRAFGLAATIAVFSGLATYLPFLKSGYHLMSLGGGKPLPISMFVSGFNGFAWFLFLFAYVVATWKVRRWPVLRLFDGALALMVVASLAIGGLAFLGATGQVQRPTMLALVEWFLTAFADGWFGLSVVGLAARFSRPARLSRYPLGLLVWTLVAAIALRSAARFAVAGPGWVWSGGIDAATSALAALVWLVLVSVVWPPSETAVPSLAGVTLWLRQIALALLMLKGAVEFAGAPPAVRQWLFAAPLHILFLHAFLLGAVSFALLFAVRSTWGPGVFRGAWAFVATVALMLAALVTLTPVWPRAWAGPWALYATAITSLGPALVALLALFRLDLGYGTRATPPSAGATGPAQTGPSV
jgi:hypothetical protein